MSLSKDGVRARPPIDSLTRVPKCPHLQVLTSHLVEDFWFELCVRKKPSERGGEMSTLAISSCGSMWPPPLQAGFAYLMLSGCWMQGSNGLRLQQLRARLYRPRGPSSFSRMRAGNLWSFRWWAWRLPVSLKSGTEQLQRTAKRRVSDVSQSQQTASVL